MYGRGFYAAGGGERRTGKTTRENDGDTTAAVSFGTANASNVRRTGRGFNIEIASVSPNRCTRVCVRVGSEPFTSPASAEDGADT